MILNDMDYDTAMRLFPEAHDWTIGKVTYMSEDSEIRKIAAETFGQAYLTHLNAVCAEIFRVIAWNHFAACPAQEEEIAKRLLEAHYKS